MVQPLLDDPGTSTHALRRTPNAHPRALLMAPDGPPASLELVLYQLGELKRKSVEDRAHVDARLDMLQAEMRSQFRDLSYVHKETYERDRLADARIAAADKTTSNEAAQETRRIAEHARTVSNWTLGFVLTGFSLMLALIKAVAG